MTHLIHKELSYAVRGVLIDVHNKIGPTLPEKFYQEAVAVGLEKRGIVCRTEKPFKVYYRRTQVGLYYVDLWIEGGKLLLELKVAPEILPIHRAQALSYLKVTDADLAIVVNFGTRSLTDERLPNFLRDKRVVFSWQPQSVNGDLLYPELVNRLLESLHRIHFELGPGFLHQIYRRATMIELQHQNLSYDYIKTLPIRYEGHLLGMQAVRLIQVDNKVALATVAVKQVDETMLTALKSRLKHLDVRLGLLANFHGEALQVSVVRG